jgi:hypothetical protein
MFKCILTFLYICMNVFVLLYTYFPFPDLRNNSSTNETRAARKDASEITVYPHMTAINPYMC